MKAKFTMNDGKTHEYMVVRQKAHRYDAMTIRISYVCIGKAAHCWKEGLLRDEYKDGLELVYSYIYEEVDNDTDAVKYCDFYSGVTVHELYAWFYEGDTATVLEVGKYEAAQRSLFERRLIERANELEAQIAGLHSKLDAIGAYISGKESEVAA